MVKILQKESPALRRKAKEVPLEEIPSEKIQKVIRDLKAALAAQEDGVAIAAPQIGKSFRIFVVSGKIKKLMGSEEENGKDGVFINPHIVRISKEKRETDEGCLSVRYLYGKVKRALKATVEGYDENGNKIRKDGHGILAQVFQHEIEHLDGILFTDKAKDIEEILPQYLQSHPDEKNSS